MADYKLVVGADEVAAAIEKWGKGQRTSAGAALYAEAVAIKNESMRRTPVDTDALRLSHQVTFPKYTPEGIEVTIGVGGSAAGYAIYVHEDLTARHKVGRAKFLESALLEALKGLLSKVAAQMQRSR